jgi:hypothetical protein
MQAGKRAFREWYNKKQHELNVARLIKVEEETKLRRRLEELKLSSLSRSRKRPLNPALAHPTHKLIHPHLDLVMAEIAYSPYR